MTGLRGETLDQTRHRIRQYATSNGRELIALQAEALVEILVELRALRADLERSR